ncbi:MAG: CAP domain-containing protein [Patescibacteria group bacterium]|nr:CAP domain-containing protein [Patescibacteria group bacterium]
MNKYSRHLHSSFIPHQGNKYLPFLMRHNSLKIIAVLAVLLKIGVSFLLIFSPLSVQPIDITNQNIINMTNQQRLNNGLNQLELNPLLSQAANAKAQDMLSKQYFSHYSPSNTSPWYWFKQAGYEYAYAGENLAMDFVRGEDIISAWMVSASHKRNILNGNYTQIGLAVLEGDFKGAKTTLVVQMFGTPAPKTKLTETTTTKEVVEKSPPSQTVTEEVTEEKSLPEVNKEETVVIPSVEENTYDIVTKLEKEEPAQEDKTEAKNEEEKKEEEKPEETKVVVQINDETNELSKKGDDYIGSVKEGDNKPNQNVIVITEDENKNVVSTPVVSTNYFKNSVLKPANFFTSERLVKMILYSRNFFMALFILLSLVLVLNLLIKVRVQHRPNIVYTLLVIYLIGIIIII